MISTDHYIRINELKNAMYCLRIPFYTLCMGLDRETGSSRMGIAAEAEAKEKSKRRKYSLHAVVDGDRVFNVPVINHRYEIVGQLDELITTPEGLYLVDYKDTYKDFGYWRVQMAAYRLAVREESDHPVLGTYIYSIPNKTYTELSISRRDEEKLGEVLAKLRQLTQVEICPPPVQQLGKCLNCQYRRFCNDVL